MKKVILIFVIVLLSEILHAQEPVSYAFTFNHLALSVKDVNRSADFYQNVLNLQEITNRTKMEGIRWFSLGEGEGITPDFNLKGACTINKAVHFALTTPDFDFFIKALNLANITYSDWPGTPDKINIRADGINSFLQDPDGYWIEVNSVGREIKDMDVVSRVLVVKELQPGISFCINLNNFSHER